MQKVLTAYEMREVDRLTTERYGTPSIILMENAAHAVVDAIRQRLGEKVNGGTILVFCGKGNNGGDGAAIARLLAGDGAVVHLILFGRISETKGDAHTNFASLPDEVQICEAEEWYQAWEYLDSTELTESVAIVDAVFGTGSKGFRDDLNEIIQSFPDVPHVAVDIPSGLTADASSADVTQYRADMTVTFTAPKPANVLSPASRYNGELRIADIGSPADLVAAQPSALYFAEQSDAVIWLEKTAFSEASYKNKRGHALILGGSRNYSGAAVLVGNAAIRTGVGLVTLGVPEDSRDGTIGRVVPEVMVRGISQTGSGSAAEAAADEIKDFLEGIDCVAIGSGLSSKEAETKRFVRRVVAERSTPVVIDADGLTALSPWATAVSDDLPLILTPHEGEFKRMLGVEGDEAKAALKDRVYAVREFATTHNVFLVLKGERNLIGSPDGRVVVNPTGNPGLGKAGNGDTLTGIIAGFVAQAVQMKLDMLETLVAAVYIAGMAGDLAAKKHGKRVMTASDVRECLVDVFAELEPVNIERCRVGNSRF